MMDFLSQLQDKTYDLLESDEAHALFKKLENHPKFNPTTTKGEPEDENSYGIFANTTKLLNDL